DELNYESLKQFQMRKFLLFLVLSVISGVSFGQATCGFLSIPEGWDFDGTPTPFEYSMQIDTVSNPSNTWQIGSPQKTTINSAFSFPNAIITDLTNAYPVNDTSVFIFTHTDMGGYSAPHTAELAGYYNVNSDSLKDYGTIEISLDQGTTWINLVSDTVYNSYYQWQTPIPTLTGNSNGWQNFWISLAQLGIPFNVNYGDTILLKFTFISDSIPDTLDGLAFDNLQFCDVLEGVEKIESNSLISIYPNPTSDLLFVNRRKSSGSESVELFGYTGELLYKDTDFRTKTIDIKKMNLPNGFYSLRYSDNRNYTLKKFIVQR
ncbi:MAG: T9SS type A sorting domain-containing protein, partial [Flavobacterium sp.]